MAGGVAGTVDVPVTLTRGDLRHFQWALALSRPVLPFLIYTTTLLVLLSLTGLWAQAGAFVPAAMLPLLAMATWAEGVSGVAWRKHFRSDPRRRFRFASTGYVVAGPDGEDKVGWSDVEAVLTTRRLLILLRRNGQADILPLRELEDTGGLGSALDRAAVPRRNVAFL